MNQPRLRRMGLFADAILGARPPSAKASAIQVPEVPLAAAGAQCHDTVFGCSPSARIPSRLMLVTFERPRLPSLTFSTARANVKFRSGSVAR